MDRRPSFRGDAPDSNKEVKKPTREMARVFIAQVKNTAQVRAELLSGVTPDQLSLFNIILAEKNTDSDVSAGQLIPVGGTKRADEKSPFATAKRRMMEETHLRPVNYESLGQLEYDLASEKDGAAQNDHIKASYYLAEVLPLDEAYSLDPERDKVAGYHKLDVEQYYETAVSGRFVVGKGTEDERELLLIDSLRQGVDGATDSNHISNLNVQAVDKLQTLMLDKLAVKESMKLIRVLEQWFYVADFSIDEIDEFMDKFNTEADTSVGKANFLRELWSYMLVNKFDGDLNKAQDSFVAAYDLSNFADEMKPNQTERSYNEMVLRSIYALLETKYTYDQYLEIIKSNKTLADFGQRLEIFINSLSEDVNPEDSKSNLIYRLRSLDDLDPEFVEGEFLKAFFDLDKKSEKDKILFESKVGQILASIDSLLDDKIVRSKLAPHVSASFNERLLSQVGEIRNASIFKLLKYALPGVGEEEKDRFRADDDSVHGEQDKSMLKRVVFEARRKLALLFLLADTDRHYDEVLNLGLAGIQESWDKILDTPKVPCYITDKYEHGGKKLKDVRVEFGETTESRAQKTQLRPLETGQGNHFLVSQGLRKKERESVYRKMIVRGYDNPAQIQDINGRSLVIVPSAETPLSEVVKKEERVLNICKTKDGIGLECELTSVVDQVAILDILEKLLQNKNIKIFDYKPTNDPGQAFESSGAGGGGKVRFAKFYIQYTERNGKLTYEEVQIFSPSEDGRSGFYWEKHKKEDDEKYEFDRLLRADDKVGIHSSVEKLHPHGVFGVPIEPK